MINHIEDKGAAIILTFQVKQWFRFKVIFFQQKILILRFFLSHHWMSGIFDVHCAELLGGSLS